MGNGAIRVKNKVLIVRKNSFVILGHLKFDFLSGIFGELKTAQMPPLCTTEKTVEAG